MDRPKAGASRQLNPEEEALLTFLLSKPFDGSEALRRQLPSTVVTDDRTDIDPTIGLTVDRSLAAPAAVRRQIPIEAEGPDEQGGSIHVLLHVHDGYLWELEVYRAYGGPLSRLPEPYRLTLIDWDDFPA